MSGVASKSIGPYQVIEFVARGDSAFVYKGFQPSMNRLVAIKMLPPSLARDNEAARSFQHQAEIMAQLDHPGILPVYDYGLDRNLPYLVSRFVEGGTLRSRIAEFRTADAALKVVTDIADALDYIHEQGLIHGNLKSSNVLFGSDDRPLLTDIGMDQSDIPGQVYLSPEGAQGGPVDRRADIYALGVLLYEMMVGQPPHIGMAPTPRQVRSDLAASIESVILKAMAQYPEQRYQTAGEFQQALMIAIQVDVDVSVSQPEQETVIPDPLVYPLPETEKHQDRRWMYIGATVLIFVIICWAALAAVAFMLARDDSELPPANGGIPTVTSTSYQYVYSGPGTQFTIEGALLAGQTAQILGVSADGKWWNILFPRAEGGSGWVAADLVSVEDSEHVPVITPAATPVAYLPTSGSLSTFSLPTTFS